MFYSDSLHNHVKSKAVISYRKCLALKSFSFASIKDCSLKSSLSTWKIGSLRSRVTSEIDPVFFRWWDVKPIPFFRGLRDIRKRMWSPLFEKEEHWCRPVWDKDTMIPLIPIGDWWWWCTCSYNFHIEMVIWRIYERERYIYMIYFILYYQRKLGSNTSELRMTFTWWNWLWWRVVRDLTIHSITIHNKRIRSGGIDLDEGW